MLDANNPSLTSWVEVPKNSDFPIQNLPFGIFEKGYARAGVAIGDFVLDLAALHHEGLLSGVDIPAGVFAQPALNDFFALGRKTITAVRNRLSALLQHDCSTLRDNADLINKVLMRQSDVVMCLPVKVGNYTDFYSSKEHASNVGSMFRGAENALLPNWKHIPVGYHGRASSIIVSGQPVFRPNGQIKLPNQDTPIFSPSRKLDFELEVAFITCGETKPGDVVPAADAENYIAGFVLFNDWSARDIQQWEYVPLGPFLGKNFASTISPWVVTLDALEPFRCAGPGQDVKVLPYLEIDGPRTFDIQLDVLMASDHAAPAVVSRSNFKYLYWNINQQLAHHTVNGCNIQVGDLYASGTISGPSPGSFGSLLELSWNGQRALTMADGSERFFLEDGDIVIIRGHAEHHGIRIGFGECSGKILPAKQIKL